VYKESWGGLPAGDSVGKWGHGSTLIVKLMPNRHLSWGNGLKRGQKHPLLGKDTHYKERLGDGVLSRDWGRLESEGKKRPTGLHPGRKQKKAVCQDGKPRERELKKKSRD